MLKVTPRRLGSQGSKINPTASPAQFPVQSA